jgi:hypothetical protein
MAEDVTINVRANTTQAKKSLSEISGSLNGIAAFTQSEAFRNIGQSLSDGFGMVAKQARAAMEETAKYGEQVRKLSYLTGASAAETSRLIQLSDDLAIDYGELGTALKAAANKGIDPSTDSLARMSEQYLKLQPGLERSQFLLDNFGRSGMALAPLLEKGSTEIRNMSAAVSENMILTEAQIAKTREYELAVDNFNDQIQGLKYSVGNDLIGAFLQLDEPMKNAVLGIAAFGGPVMNAVISMGQLAFSMKALGITLPALSGGFTAFGASAMAALAPLLPLLIAIAGLIALVNSDFGKQGIAAGKQLLTIGAAGIAGAIGGQDAAADVMGRGAAWASPAAAGGGGQTLIYNNYGVDTSNVHAKNAISPFVDQTLRDNNLR